MAEKHENDGTSPPEGKCPVDHKGARSLWGVLGGAKPATGNSKEEEDLLKRNTPASLEAAAKYAQTPHPDQRLPLSVHRAESSIPRGEEGNKTHHQTDASTNWVYPSEQQVFNAMKRKGWKGVEEESIPSFIQIHNTVNERSWRQLCDWEGNGDIKLVRFQGKPQTLTPKAWLWTNVLFQEKPFDRHDWYIDNGVNHEKRYVLDFYMEENKRTGMPKVEIDVRPALDSPQAFVERAQRLAKDMFPGISKELERMQESRK